jgi:lambda family phage portal protein
MSGAFPAPARYAWHDGEKYPGGFGPTDILQWDYWTLRQRSVQLYHTNIYARGIVRRLVTNIISTGLELEAQPDERLLGVEPGSLLEWSEDVEARFALWAYSPALCDYKGLQSFGSLQAAAKMAALVSGDVLVVLQQDSVTGLPQVRLVDGARVQSPFGVGQNEPNIPKGHIVRHGVELDAQGRHVAYWIVTPEEGSIERRVQRLPAVGPTGRRMAFLVYGTDKLLDAVRGEPILSIILQSLKEIDRYRDAAQRKAALGATLAVFLKREKEVMASRQFTGVGGGAERRNPVAVGEQPTEATRTFDIVNALPGTVMQGLAPGEEPHTFQTATDQHFPEFERCLISAIAWSLEIPPEILQLSFSSNYSASQAAIQELRLTLQPWRQSWAEMMCAPVYVDWLLSEVLGGRIKADGLLESWRDPTQFTTFNAWIGSDFVGATKPHIDMNKTAAGYTQIIEQGLITRDRAARELTGMKYSKVVARLKVENEMLAEANKALREAEQAAAPKAPNLRVVEDPNKEDNDEEDEKEAG